MPELSIKESPEKSSTTSWGPSSIILPRTPVSSGAVAMSSSPARNTTLSPLSPITRVLSKKINVLNHLAYLVEALRAEATRLLTMGFVQVAEARPAIAYDGRLIQFFVAPSRLMIELIEAPGHQHRYHHP